MWRARSAGEGAARENGDGRSAGATATFHCAQRPLTGSRICELAPSSTVMFTPYCCCSAAREDSFAAGATAADATCDGKNNKESESP